MRQITLQELLSNLDLDNPYRNDIEFTLNVGGVWDDPALTPYERMVALMVHYQLTEIKLLKKEERQIWQIDHIRRESVTNGIDIIGARYALRPTFVVPDFSRPIYQQKGVYT